MSGKHQHASAISAAGRHKRPLVIALSLTATYTVVEVVVGLAVGSLALVSDAGHMLTDVAVGRRRRRSGSTGSRCSPRS